MENDRSYDNNAETDHSLSRTAQMIRRLKEQYPSPDRPRYLASPDAETWGERMYVFAAM